MEKMKHSIEISADVETCYRCWANYHNLPNFMRRILKVWDMELPLATHTSALEDMRKAVKAELSNLSHTVPLHKIRHWLVRGPGGKIYEVENAAILEIPNLFYCWASTDPNDLAIHNSISFMAIEDGRKTVLLYESSFVLSGNKALGGKSSRLISDIVDMNDPWMQDLLTDFKNYVEKNDADKAKKRKPLSQEPFKQKQATTPPISNV